MKPYEFTGSDDGRQSKEFEELQYYRKSEVDVLKALYFRPSTMAELVERLGYSRDAVWKALIRLQVRGNIRRKEKKTRGFKKKRPYNIRYELNPEYEGNMVLIK